MKRLLLALALGVLALACQGADLAADIAARLVNAPLLRGQFEQKKNLAGFKQALVSSGDFLLWRDHGLCWHTRTPFDSSLTLTRRGITQTQGTTTLKMDAKKEPGLLLANDILFALLSGDVSLLAQRFQMSGKLVGAEGWQLRLVPTDAALTKVFKNIELSGARFVQDIRLEDMNGDLTAIRFSQTKLGPAATPEEVKSFAD